MVMFGGVDHRYYKGELNWVPLIQVGDWIVHMTGKPLPLRVSPSDAPTNFHGHRQTHTNAFSDTQSHRLYTTHNDSDRHTDTWKHISRHI